MKKFILLLSLALCCVAFLSCKKETKDDSGYHYDDYPPDTSLAGSVWMNGYYLREVEGSYDGTDFQDLNHYRSTIDVWKVSDTEMCLYVGTAWGETEFGIEVPVIPLTGKPYDVAFDATSDKATLEYNKSQYNITSVTVKGWIREKSIKPSKSLGSRTSIALKNYKCEINITCTVDGKPLILKITEVGESPKR